LSLFILFTHETNKVFRVTLFLVFVYQEVLGILFLLFYFFLESVIYKQWTTKKI
jgi:hypothetical protein